MKRLSSKELLSLQEDCNKKLQEDFLGEACPPDCGSGGFDDIVYDLQWINRTVKQWGNPYPGGSKDVHYLLHGLKNWGEAIPPGGE